jgi:2-polyprenyl-6-methoxyphenol hydroxylase-like FAD-dependent oxidoreductase
MSPFAGEGVNLAMLDALELALSIVQHNDLAQAIETYEEKMYEYSSEKARESYDNLKLIFSDDAAAKLSNLMNQYHEQYGQQ